MEMVSVSEFVSELRLRVSGFMPAVLPRSVINAAIRFCEDTNVAVFDAEFDNTAKNQQINIESTLIDNGVDLTGLSITSIVRIVGDGESLYTGEDYSEQSKETITIFDDYDTLTVTVSVAPKRNATMVPEILFDDWFEAILSGAASYLYKLPENQNANLYQFHESDYIEKMRKAKRWRLESLSHQSFSSKSRQRDFY